MEKSDSNIQETWLDFQQGDKSAFAMVYNSFIDALYKYGTKICTDEDLVKDAIQEVFLDLFLKRKKNKSNPENLKFYLILALKRNLIKKVQVNRKLLLINQSHEILFEPVYSTEKTTIETEEDLEKKQRINFILEQLPPKQKEIIYLRFNEGLEYPEIAQIMEISVDSARKQVYRGLKSVRDKFKKESLILLLCFSKSC